MKEPTKTLIYLIGEPGSGKSTLIREFTKDWEAQPFKTPIPHIVYSFNGEVMAVQLGADHPTFPGTDRLSYSVHAKATAFVSDSPFATIIGEGDRLTTTGFITGVTGRNIVLVLLDAERATLAERRNTRGTEQNETWLRSRRTKVNNLWNTAKCEKVKINAKWSLSRQVAVLRNIYEGKPALASREDE